MLSMLLNMLSQPEIRMIVHTQLMIIKWAGLKIFDN